MSAAAWVRVGMAPAPPATDALPVARRPAEGRTFFVVLGALVGVALVTLVVTLGTLVVAFLAA